MFPPHNAIRHMSLYQFSDFNGPPNATVLVALPGLGGTGLSFPEEAFDELHEAGVKVYFADYGDHVESVSDMAMAIWTALTAVGVFTPVILLGFSMGGFVAQTMYEQSPNRVKGIVFLSTTCFTLDDAVQTLLQDTSQHVKRGQQPLGAGRPPGMVSEEVYKRELSAVTQYITANTCRFFSTVTVPVLSIYGAKDSVIAVKSMKKLRKLAKTVPFEEYVFVNGSHRLIYESPHKFGNIVTKWVSLHA